MATLHLDHLAFFYDLFMALVSVAVGIVVAVVLVDDVAVAVVLGGVVVVAVGHVGHVALLKVGVVVAEGRDVGQGKVVLTGMGTLLKIKFYFFNLWCPQPDKEAFKDLIRLLKAFTKTVIDLKYREVAIQMFRLALKLEKQPWKQLESLRPFIKPVTFDRHELIKSTRHFLKTWSGWGLAKHKSKLP